MNSGATEGLSAPAPLLTSLVLLQYRIPQIQLGLLHILTYTSKLTTRAGKERNFPIVNYPFICSNIPAAPTYGIYISQLIRYSRACVSYQDFLDGGLLLTRKLLNQMAPVTILLFQIC